MRAISYFHCIIWNRNVYFCKYGHRLGNSSFVSTFGVKFLFAQNPNFCKSRDFKYLTGDCLIVLEIREKPMKGGRKNLKRAAGEQSLTLQDGQSIMQVVSLRGSNLIEVFINPEVYIFI